MKELPILMAAPMVVATLEGRKTKTRREIKRLSGFGPITEFGPSDTPGYAWHFRNKRMLWNDLTHAELLATCPYGQPGDRLWVRETYVLENGGGEYEVKIPTDGTPYKSKMVSDGEGSEQEVIEVPHYRATEPDAEIWPWACLEGDCDHDEDKCHAVWEPSIFMPRWASRIDLGIVKIRVERLQDISEEDAEAEGIQLEQVKNVGLAYRHPTDKGRQTQLATLAFQWLWESINGPDSWEANPWVWVVDFKRVRP